MLDFMINVWNRVVNNWRTSAVAIIAGGVIVTKWLGIIVTADEIMIVLVAIEAIVLLFAKD